MAYTKLNIQTGNKLEVAQLTHIESNIIANETEIAKKLGWTQLWSNASSTFGEGYTSTINNLSNYTLLIIVTNNGAFALSGTGYKSMYYTYPDTDEKTLKTLVRYFQIVDNKIWFSYCHKEDIHDEEVLGYETTTTSLSSRALVPLYIFGII